ncbi:unnamed protein product [Phytomonas sp. Hart1]|nr:unnamed protein product [Phytomonas sp. Hart1]|eukprot:CCW68210.1 unnamed protein product [Phytomonas sp. isolate Hart1]
MPTHSNSLNNSVNASLCSTEFSHFEIHKDIEAAVWSVWNNQYEEAQHILCKKKDTHPRYALEWANIMLVKSLMTSTNDDRLVLLDLFKAADHLASFMKHNEPPFSEDDADDEGTASGQWGHSMINTPHNHSKPKKYHHVKKKDAIHHDEAFDYIWKFECDVVYAEALLMRGICQLMMNSYFKGGINLRKAWGCYNSLLHKIEEDKAGKIPKELKMCVKYGTGTFYSFLALVPGNLMKLLSLIGFVSDKDVGERYLTEVFESNTIRSPFAGLVLCTLYLFLPTGLGDVGVALSRANKILESMNVRCPNNTYFYGYANFYHRKKGDVDTAMSSISLALKNSMSVGVSPLLIKYVYADTLFMYQDWSEALKQYLALLDHIQQTKESFTYTGQVALSVAACYVMVGKYDEAMDWMRRVNPMHNPKSKSDVNSPKFALRVIANPRLLPYSAVYMLYINRDLVHMRKEQGERVLSDLKNVLESKDITGAEATNMYNLFVGVIEKGCGNSEVALQYFQKIFDAEKHIPKESMVLPFAYYEAAEIRYRMGNLSEAKHLFDKGHKIKGDGNETLSNRYRIAMKQLKHSIAV